MKCKICGAHCIVAKNSRYSSYYCETYPDDQGGHYRLNTLIFSNTNIESYKYNDFLIYKYYDYNTGNCKEILVFILDRKTKQYIKLNISTGVFNKMNFDPKNPRSVLDKLELLKCFY